MHGGSAFAGDQAAVGGMQRPDAVEFQAAVGADAGLGDGGGVEGFDGVQVNAGEMRLRGRGSHGSILA